MSIVQHFRIVVRSSSASSMTPPMKALQYFKTPRMTYCYIPEDLFLQLGMSWLEALILSVTFIKMFLKTALVS
jgi:hypothetical protein